MKSLNVRTNCYFLMVLFLLCGALGSAAQIFTVNTNGDNGGTDPLADGTLSGTLRKGIVEVNAGNANEIHLDFGLTGGSVVLEGALSDITPFVGIVGNGVAINGVGTYPGLRLVSGGNVSNLTIRNANGNTGALAANGTIQFINLTIENSTSGGAAGGINLSGASGSMDNCKFFANTGINGGAIQISGGPISITNSVFNDNNSSGFGGALFVSGGGMTRISESYFEGNNGSNGGGGLYVTGVSTNLTLENVTLYNNNGFSNGGAIYGDNAGLIRLFNVTASGNSATSGAGISNVATDFQFYASILFGNLLGNDYQHGSAPSQAYYYTNIVGTDSGGGTTTFDAPTSGARVSTDPLFVDLSNLSSSLPEYQVGLQRMFIPSSSMVINGGGINVVSFDQTGTLRGTGKQTLGALEINMDPVLTLPSNQSGATGAAFSLGGPSVMDDDSDDLEVTISAANLGEYSTTSGLIVLNFSGTSTAVTGGANNSSSVTILGSIADINTVLSTAQYDPNNIPGQHQITVTVTDNSTLYPGAGNDSGSYQIDVSGTYDSFTNGDSGAGTLRAAITDANNISGADIIDLSGLTPGTIINLTSALPAITDDLTIIGPAGGGVIIPGNSPVFQVLTTGVDLNLNNITITGGSNTNGGGIEFNPGLGGGALNLVEVRIEGNTATSGGGIYYNSDGAGSVIHRSLIYDNDAATGAGITIVRGNIDIYNSTIGENTSGEGIYVDGATGGSVLLWHSTVTGNDAEGLLSANGGLASFQFSILYGNTGNDLDAVAAGDLNDGGVTSVVGTSPHLGSLGSVISTNPVLSVITTNNDNTDGYAPSITGSALNGAGASGEFIDQVGNSRLAGYADLGALEANPAIISATFINNDGDRIIDQMVVELTEPVDWTTADNADFSLNIGSVDPVLDAATANNGMDMTDADEYVTFPISGYSYGTGTTDGSTPVTLAFMGGVMTNTDPSTKFVDSNASINVIDGALPEIDPIYIDSDGNGQVDQVRLQVSEIISYASMDNAIDGSFNSGDFAIDTHDMSAVDTELGGVDDDVIVITLVESGSPDTGVTMNGTILGASLIETIGNPAQLINGSAVDLTGPINDAAPPVILTTNGTSSPYNGETGVNIGITTVTLEFSETVSLNTPTGSLFYINDYLFENAAEALAEGDITDPAGTTTATVTLAGGNFVGGTSYYFAMDPDLFVDANLNTNNDLFDKDYLTFETAGAPTLNAVAYLDTDDDGNIDQIGLGFSAGVYSTDNTAGDDPTDFIDSGGAITISPIDLDQFDGESIIFLPITPIAGTGDPGFTVTYDNAQTGHLYGADLVSEVITGTIQYFDLAAPVVVSVTGTPNPIRESDIGGTFELWVEYSEEMDVTPGNEPSISPTGYDPGAPGGELSGLSAGWTNGTYTNSRYVFTANIVNDLDNDLDVGMQVEPVDIEPDGEMDYPLDVASSDPNVQQNTYIFPTAFSIQMVDAPPLIADATWNDQDGNGNIDQVVLAFDQSVEITDGDAGNGFDAIEINGGAIAIDNANYALSGVTTLTLNFLGNEYSGTSITGLSLAYNTSVLNSSIVGTAGSFEMDDATSPGVDTDGAAPILLSSTPADDATNILVASNVSLTFSEPVNFGTGLITLTDLTNGSLNDTYDVGIPDTELSGGGTAIITINPAVNFNNSEEYSIRIATTALNDGAGNNYAGIGDDITLNFFSESSGPHYTITWRDIDGNGTIDRADFRFNAGVDITDATPGSGVFDAFSISAPATWVSVNNMSSNNLGANVVYPVNVANMPAGTGPTVFPTVIYVGGGDINVQRDSDNFDMLSGETPTDIIDGAVPILVSSIPANSATAVAVGDDMSLTFSEPIIAGTGNVELVNIDDVSNTQYNVTTASQLSGFGTNTITINPDADLLSFKNYRIRVDATALDDEAAVPNSFAGLDNTTGINFQTSAVVPTYTATWLDANPPDGTIDQLQLDFNTSVNVVDANGATAGFDAISISGGITITNTNDLSAGGVNSILLDIAGTPTDNTSNLTETITYNQGSSSIVAVTGGLEIADTDNPTTLLDGALPILLSSLPIDGGTTLASANLSLTFSEPVVAGSGNIEITDGGDGGATGFTYDVTTATELSGFNTSTVVINPASDLAQTETYAIQVGASAIEDIEGNLYAGIGDNTTLDFATLGNVPTFTVTWLDNGGTGNINQALLTFSTPVNIVDGNGATAGFDALSITGATITDVTDLSGNTQNTLLLNISGITGTATSSTVTYTQANASSIIADDGGALEVLEGFDADTYIDQAAPIVTNYSPAHSATGVFETADIILTFSEDVVANAGDISIIPVSPAGATITIPIGGAQVDVTNNVVTINPSADLGLLTLYNVNIVSGALQDLAVVPNDYTGITGANYEFTTKGQSPEITSATWTDEDNDGVIDLLTLAFDLAVDVADADDAAGGFDAISISGGVITIDNVNYDALNTTTLALQVSNVPSGTASPSVTVTYNTAGTSTISAIAGLGGEEMVNGDAADTYVDAAPPVIVAAVTGDANANGRIENILVTFSEALNDGASTLGNVDIGTTTYTGEAGVTGTANDNAVRITFTQGLTGDTDATPTVDMAANSFFDGSGNALGSVQNFGAATDGAGPAIIAALTGDVNSDGAIDRMVLTFSENVDDGVTPINAANINVFGAPYTGEAEVASTTGDTEVIISFTNGGAGFDTENTPNVVLSAGGAVDADGNTVSVTQNFNGTTDGAPPVIQQVVTEASNLYVTVTFSEGVYSGSVGGGLSYLTDTQEDLQVAITSGTAVLQGVDQILTTADGILAGNETDVRLYFSYSGSTAGTDIIEVEALNSTTVVDGAGNGMVSPLPSPQAAGSNLNEDLLNVSTTPTISEVRFYDSGTPDGKIDRLGFLFGAFSITADEDGNNTTREGNGLDCIVVRYNGNIISQLNEDYEDQGTITPGNELVMFLDTSDPDLPAYTGVTGFTIDYVNGPDRILSGGAEVPFASPITTTEADYADPYFANFSTTLLDLNVDGTVDAIRVDAADEINDALLGSGTWTYGGTSLTPQTGNSTSDATFTFTFTGGSGTAVDPTDDFVFVSGVLTDNGSNTLSGTNNASTTVLGSGVLDGAAPVIISALTLDSQPDGIIDQMEITFSEPINDPTLTFASFQIGGETGNGSVSFDGSSVYTISFPNGGNTTATPDVYLAASTVSDISTNTNPNPEINTFTNTEDGAGAFVQLDDQDGTAPYDNYPKVYTSLTPTINGYIDDPSAIILVNVGGSGVLGTNLGDGTWTANVTLSDAITYDVAITALDPEGNVSNDLTLDEIIINGGVTITAPDQPNACIDADFIDLGTIIITENNVQDFRTSGSMLLQLPANFIFNTSATVTAFNSDVSPTDGSDVGISYSYLGNTILVLTFTVSSETAIDNIRIEGLQIKGTGSASSGNLTIFTSSASIFGSSGKVYASMTSNYTASALTGFDVTTLVEDATNVVEFGTPLGEDYTIDLTGYMSETDLHWYDDSAVPVLVYDAASPTANQTNLSAGIDVNTVGIYSMEVSQYDGTCESNPLFFNVLVYDDTDPYEGGNSFISRFYNDTQDADTIYLSNPVGYTVNISSSASSGFSIVNVLADPIKVVFNPTLATVGTYTVTYTVEDDVTGATVNVVRTLEVLPAPPLFVGAPADVYCDDDGIVSLELTNSFNASYGVNPYLVYLQATGQVNGGSAQLAGSDLHNGTNVNAINPKLVTAPYTFKFRPDTVAVNPGSYENIRFFTRIVDVNGFSRVGAEDYFIVYGSPALTITNIADNETYCAGDDPITIRRNLTYVSAMNVASRANPIPSIYNGVNEAITEGYVIYRSTDNGATYDGYGGAPGTVFADLRGVKNEFDPEDPDNDGTTYLEGDLDDIGYFLIEYTPGPLGPNNCESVVTKEIQILPQPAMLDLTETDILAAGGFVSYENVDDYVVEICTGSYMPYVGVEGNGAADATERIQYHPTTGAGPLSPNQYLLLTRGGPYPLGTYYGYGYISSDNGSEITFQFKTIFNTSFALEPGDYLSWLDPGVGNYVEYGIVDGISIGNPVDITWYDNLLSPISTYENSSLLPSSEIFNMSGDYLNGAQNRTLYFSTSSGGCESDIRKVTFKVYGIASAPALDLTASSFTVGDVRTGSTTGYDYKFDYCAPTTGGSAIPENLDLSDLNPGQQYEIYTYYTSDFNTIGYSYVGSTSYDQATYNGSGNHNISGDVLAGNASYRYDVYLRDNVSGTGFVGCLGYLTRITNYGYDLPAPVSEADFNLNTLTFHVSEGQALTGGIVHTFTESIEEYSWYGDAGATDVIETLTSGNPMTQGSLNSLVDPSNDQLALSAGLILDKLNDGDNDTLTYYVDRRKGIQTARNFDGCVSDPLTPVRLIVHAKQPKATIVSDNFNIGTPNYTDLMDAKDHSFAICLDQVNALSEFDASALFSSSGSPEGSQYFRWYSSSITDVRGALRYEGTDATFSSLGLTSASGIGTVGDYYFEIVQVTDSITYSIGNKYNGVEGESTFIKVAVVANETISYTTMSDLNENSLAFTSTDFTNQTVLTSLLTFIPSTNTFCIDDSGTNGLGDIEMNPNVTVLGINPGPMDPARASYQIISYGFDNLSDPDTTIFPIRAGLPVLDLDSLHSIADLTTADNDTVGGYHSIHEIIIYYTQPDGECDILNTTFIAIAPKPDIYFTVRQVDDVDYSIIDPNFGLLYDEFCFENKTYSLNGYTIDGTKVSGTFSGNGIEGSLATGFTFRPSAAHEAYWTNLKGSALSQDPQYYGQSSHVIRFDYTDGDGCDNFIETTLYVNPNPYIVGTAGNQVIYDAICRNYPIEAHVDLFQPLDVLETLNPVVDYSPYTFSWSSITAGQTNVLSAAGTNSIIFESSPGVGYSDNSFNMSVTVTNMSTCDVSVQENDVQNYAPIPTITYVGLTANGIDGLEIFLHEEEPSLPNTNVDSTYVVLYGPAAVPTTASPIAYDITVYDPNIYQPINIVGALTTGNYLVVATMYSQGGCVVSNADQRVITILDNIYLDPLGASDYFATFDGAAGDPTNISGDNNFSDRWYIERATANGKTDALAKSWEHGATGTNRTFNGNHFETGLAKTTGFIVTNPNGEYGQSEKSYVYSPAFDLTDFANPALSFERSIDFDNERDGVILQVSYDDGRNWNVLGDFDLTSGINWYNNQGVSSGPGEGGREPEQGSSHIEQVAFTGDDVDLIGNAYWRESRHRIGKSSDDLVPGDSLTRFRFALATTGGSKGGKGGFAFDNFKIFEINKLVLVEQFSTSLDMESERYMNELILDATVSIPSSTPSVDWEAGTEGLLMNYHTDFLNDADIDYINSNNRVDPSTRATYYGLLNAPATRIGGYYFDFDIDTSPQDFYNGFDVTALDEEEFSVTFNSVPIFDISSGTISATVDFIAQGDLAQDEVLFFVAVIEKATPTGAGGVYPTAYHVVRKLLPSAGGHYVRRTFLSSDAEQISVEWNIGDVLSNSYDLTDGIRLIAFAQDYKTGEILQANFADLTVSEPVVTGLEELLASGYNIYPNPSDKVMNIELAEVPERDVYWKISDQSGREVLRGKINRGSKSPEPIDSSKLPSGLYIIQLSDDERNWTPRKVLITH